jgi:pSer/pThr/pTyr-binding forkhead associated (FHA) protein
VARLILEFNQEVLKDYPVRSRGVTIGRHEDNTIVLDNPRVSGYHARIDKTGFDYILTDLQSTNGTFVNSENIVSRKLLHGDRIKIGEHFLLFVGTEKAKVEAERENIPLNQTVIIGAKPKSKDVSPLPEIERPEFGIREVKRSRPYARITPIFIAIIVVLAGGWLLLSQGPLLMKMIFEKTAPRETVGNTSNLTDRESMNTPLDTTASLTETENVSDEPLSADEIERPEASSPQEEASLSSPSEDSDLAATQGDEPAEETEPTVPGALFDERFKLDGIVWSSDAEQSFAVINGNILRLGGSIEGVVVTDIGRNYVVLRSREDDSEIKLTIR